MSIVRFDPFRTIRELDRVADAMWASPGLAAPRSIRGEESGPAYDIEQVGGDSYLVTLAVPGFTRDELEIRLHDRALTVRGTPAAAEPAADEKNEVRVLRKGIASGSFERAFRLAEHIEIAGAELDAGLLRIRLERRLPETLKPRTITIGEARDAA